MKVTRNGLSVGVLALTVLFYIAYSLFQINRLSNEITTYKSRSNTTVGDKSPAQPNLLEIIKTDIARGLDENSSTGDIILASMRYVHENSLHPPGYEYEDYAFDIPVVLEKIVAAKKNSSVDKPLLTCGPRAYAMRSILGQFNIYSRLIQVYSDHYDTVQGHRMLEVFNPDFQRWELWDPDYGVTYVDRTTNEPTDIISLVFSDKEQYIPVGKSNKGWEETKSTHLKERYFKSVLFEQDRGLRNSVLIINQSLFDTKKTFESDFTFIEWAKHHYHYPRIILLPMESGNRAQGSGLTLSKPPTS